VQIFARPACIAAPTRTAVKRWRYSRNKALTDVPSSRARIRAFLRTSSSILIVRFAILSPHISVLHHFSVALIFSRFEEYVSKVSSAGTDKAPVSGMFRDQTGAGASKQRSDRRGNNLSKELEKWHKSSTPTFLR
jgi:hypothetical protein